MNDKSSFWKCIVTASKLTTFGYNIITYTAWIERYISTSELKAFLFQWNLKYMDPIFKLHV